MTIIDKLNQFESGAAQTVAEFNKIFTNCPILEASQDDEVEVGEIFGPDNVRVVTVGARSILHTFDTLPPETIADQVQRDRREVAENSVMAEKEMELEPNEYQLLQFLRGSAEPLLTQAEIAGKLRRSLRSVNTAIRQLEEKNIITQKYDHNLRASEYIIAEEWL